MTRNFSLQTSQLRSKGAQEHMISSGEALSGAKNCVFTGMVALRVAKVGSVFPRASIWENCQQEAHETAVIEPDLHVKTSMKDIHLQTLLEDEVCKMRMGRFAWDAFTLQVCNGLWED